jgi:hypothetical protein
MRRILAIGLLLLFASAYVLPMVMSDDEQKLPPCCRRDGKHHCSMMDKIPSSGGDGFHVVRSKCPCWPSGTVSSNRQNAFVCTAALIYGEFVSHPAFFAQTEAGYIVSRVRSHQKRGPPSLL